MAKPGLYANIHAKKKRIASGSGEKMRKPGTKGAPTKQAFINSAKTAKKAQTGTKASSSDMAPWKLVKEKVKPSGVIKRKYKSEDGLYSMKTKGRPDQYPSETNPEFTGKYTKSRTLKGALKRATPAKKMVMQRGGIKRK
jgi:hypothetical protein